MFPSGFVIPTNPVITLGSGFVGCTASPKATAVSVGDDGADHPGSGCEIGDNAAATLSIAGITNPPAGTYSNTSFLVFTTEDAAGSPASNVVITGTAPMTISQCSGSTGNAAFLCSVYVDLLGRAPDAGGLSAWLNALAVGVSRAQVAYDIATSQESRSDLVQGDYLYFLGRAADPLGLAVWVGQLNAGASRQSVLQGILGSAEFYNDAGATPSGFVMAIYRDLLGRTADSGGLSTFVGELNSGVSRSRVVGGLVYSNEYETDFVNGLYFYLLDRGADPGGLATFVGQLRGGASEEQVIAEIVGSPEYYALSQL